MKSFTFRSDSTLYVCLPYLEMSTLAPIELGPAHFWSGAHYSDQLDPHLQTQLLSYLETLQLLPKEVTFLSVSKKVAVKDRESLLIDSLYLFYFISAFKELYEGKCAISFEPFRFLIPTTEEFISHPSRWQQIDLDMNRVENKLSLAHVDKELVCSLGVLLGNIYIKEYPLQKNQTETARRIIRAIRYLMDRFFQRFVNLNHQGLTLPEVIFEPEEILFLVSSFETLFDIAQDYPAADFKHKLRPLLHLKHSKPLELFWKWVDEFYEVRRQIIHKGESPDPFFISNQNFRVSHPLIGIKLFIYSVYYSLYHHHLISSKEDNSFTPTDFTLIHPEKFLIFFWSESSLLRKLHIYLKDVQTKKDDDELLADIELLTKLFVIMFENYYLHPHQENVLFFPTSNEVIENDAREIIHVISQSNQNKTLSDSIHPHFLNSLKKRLGL